MVRHRPMRAALLVAVIAVVALVACSTPEPSKPVPSASPPPSLPPVAAPIPDPPPPELRLPGDVKPTQYALDLTILPDQPTAAGRIHIAAKVARPAQVVWLNATGLAIEHA